MPPRSDKSHLRAVEPGETRITQLTAADEMTRDICRAILRGDYDKEQLNQIAEAVSQRRRLDRDQETAVARVSLRAGDAAEIHGFVRKNTELNGIVVKVEDIRRTKAVIRMPSDKGPARWRGHQVTISLSCLKPVEKGGAS